MMANENALQRLRQADWLKLPGVQRVFELLGGDTGQVRAVGGIVRDSLIGCLGGRIEVDFASVLTPDDVTARAKRAGIAVIPTGIEHGTVTLVIEGQTFEVTTLRQDVETDGRWATVAFGTDWAVDAARRDFTLNALYCGPDGSLFDPLDGLDDCLAQRVRFIGDAAQRIAEDRLRVFRFFRFSASHGSQNFDADGMRAITAASHLLGALSAERVGHEMMRLMALPAVVKTLSKMVECRVLAKAEIPLNPLAQYEDMLEIPMLEGRLALIAKQLPLKNMQQKWRLSNALIKKVHDLSCAADLLAKGEMLSAAYHYPAHVGDAVALAAIALEADHSWTQKVHAELNMIKAAPLPVSGKDLLAVGLPAGKELGLSLKRLEDAWIESAFSLTRPQLLALVDKP